MCDANTPRKRLKLATSQMSAAVPAVAQTEMQMSMHVGAALRLGHGATDAADCQAAALVAVQDSFKMAAMAVKWYVAGAVMRAAGAVALGGHWPPEWPSRESSRHRDERKRLALADHSTSQCPFSVGQDP